MSLWAAKPSSILCLQAFYLSFLSNPSTFSPPLYSRTLPASLFLYHPPFPHGSLDFADPILATWRLAMQG